jgi:TRAP-type mannitol/chloroaromatic compound transport system permease large subunit
MGVPVNLLYSAAFGPGLMLAGSYVAYTMIRSFITPSLGPAMTSRERADAYQAMTTEEVNAGVLAVGAIALLAIVYVLSSALLGSLGLDLPQYTFSIGRRKPDLDVVAAILAVASLIPFFVNRYFRAIILGIAPLAALIGATLGTILKGAATPTEAASCGAAGAALLALIYGKLSLAGPRALALGGTLAGVIIGAVFGNVLIPGLTGLAFAALCLALIPGFVMSPQMRAASYGTMVTSGMVLFLAVASNVFGAVFTKLGTAGVITNGLIALPLGDWMKLFLIMAIIFVLGWPFEWPAIILVFLPIFLPVVEKLQLGLSKLDLLIWFGALIAVNLQTAYLSPPVAMSAYYLKNVVPQWSLGTIYRGMADYMIIQVIVLVLMLFFPEISLWLVHAVR